MANYKYRAKRHYIPLTFKHGLLISVRRFRTNADRRSRRYKQLVISFRQLPIKELAIRRIDQRSAKKLLSAERRRPRIDGHRLRYQTLALIFLVAVGLVGSVFFGLQIAKPSQIDLTGNTAPLKIVKPPEVMASTPSLPRSKPVHISIASVGIDADVVQTGLNADHTITVPEDWHVAGWYEYSPTPGEKGPSIIVGHVDNVSGLGVFWRLHEMSVGDEIDILRADGRTIKFKVDDIKQYPRDNFPSQKVYGPISEAGLRLITCGGSFDRSIHEYDENTVVFANLVN